MKLKDTKKSKLKKITFNSLARKIKLLGIAFFLFCTIIFAILGSLFAIELNYASEKIPDLPNIITNIAKPPTKITSADGKTLFTLTTQYRQPVIYKELPKHVINATLAAEDRRFYEHSGIDFVSILRGVFVNVKSGRIAQGGSTLTMQIAKRVYTHNKPTLKRKLQDAALAIMMERELTKNQIIELYLNQVYFGAGAYGIKAAAEVYFDKKLNELTIAEAALISRLVRRPSTQNPFKNPKVAIRNRNYVLRTMLDEKMITRSQYLRAINEKLNLSKKDRWFVSGKKKAPYFVDYVLAYVRKNLSELDLKTGGYHIQTTVDTRMQAIADKELKKHVDQFRKRNVSTGSFLLTDRLGQIKAMVGGYDYENNQYNMTRQGGRQPGSAFKPLVYAIALERGKLKPGDTLSNERYYWRSPSGKVWAPRNYNGKYGGRFLIEDAIAKSVNICAIRAAEKVGGSKVVKYAREIFGITGHMDPGLSIALGCSDVSPVDMAKAYSIFMLKGDRATPYGIRRIIGPDGQVAAEFAPQIRPRIMKRYNADFIDKSLRKTVLEGTGRKVKYVINAHGKTGTTNDYIDSWFCGYTDELLGIAWIANEVKNTKKKGPRWIYRPMKRVFGGTVAAPMWGAIVSQCQKLIGEQPVEEVENPDEIADVENNPHVEGDPNQQSVENPQNPQPEASKQNDEEAPLNEPIEIEEKKKKEPDPEVKQKKKKRSGDSEYDQIEEALAEKKEDSHTKREDKEQVVVEICVESGKRSGRKCRGLIVRTYDKGTEPTEICNNH